MPSPWRSTTCAQCGRTWSTRSASARTCSPKCRAELREVEKPSRGAAPRDYAPELVAQVRALYESGMTRAEVQSEIGAGVKVENVLRRYGIERRPASARVGLWRGDKNAQWRGDDAGYQALHLRVQAARGKPQHCEHCDTTEPGRYEWANLTGNYADIDDYARMCVSCHRHYDAARRAITGKRTSPDGRRSA